MASNFRYVKASTLADAARRTGPAGAYVHAGGTDLMGCIRDEVFPVDTVVSIAGLTDLDGISTTADGGLRIGALTTLSRIAASDPVVRLYPALAQGAAAAASPQLRNQGTIGGNICQKPRCWYYRGEFHCVRKGGGQCFAYDGQNQYHCVFGGDTCYIVHPSDTAPALVAYGAEARVTGPDGSRRIPLETFHMRPSDDPTRETVLAPGEVVTDIVLPPPPSGGRGLYRKVRARQSWDFALVGVAMHLTTTRAGVVDDARVVLSGVAPFPWRSQPTEKVLVGAELDADTAFRAGEAAAGGAEPLALNGYKVPLIRSVVEEAVLSFA